MLLLRASRSAALLLALAASPAAAGPSLRGRALQSGDAPVDSGDGADGESYQASTARLGEDGCALRERAGPPCEDPDADCEAVVAFDCEDYATGYMYRVENDMVGIATGDGTFAFEDDAGAHLLDGNGDVTFLGEAEINLDAYSVTFISGTFVRHAPAAHLYARDVDPGPIDPDTPAYEEEPDAYDEPDHVDPAPEIPAFADAPEGYASGDVPSDGAEASGDVPSDADAYGSADAPTEEAVEVAGTAAVSQAGSQGTLNSVKGEYEVGEDVHLDFTLTAGDSGYKIGIFMRMADPQEGTLPPIVALPLPPGLMSGRVTFSRQTMGMMNWPLDLYMWGTGYDAYVLDANGVDVVGPAQFNILLDE